MPEHPHPPTAPPFFRDSAVPLVDRGILVPWKPAPIPWFSDAPETRARADGQTVFARVDGELASLTLPGEDGEVMPGVTWGRCDTLFTPAYWRAQVWFWELEAAAPATHALGRTLAEEIAACLLGGHGIPAEVGLAAFEHLRNRGLLCGEPPDEVECYTVLCEPLQVGGRLVRYRFARQKSAYLSSALRALRGGGPPESSERGFRDWLISLPGFGPKTASWVTRNWLNSDAVAILDVHVHRAGLLAGFFLPRHTLPSDYEEMEERFLRFSRAIGVRPALLDALIWRDMRSAGDLARNLGRVPYRRA
jgi:N-glycosylase/DNA lyase